jgi:hypothetical protein
VVGIMTEALVGPPANLPSRKGRKSRIELITTMTLGAVRAAG